MGRKPGESGCRGICYTKHEEWVPHYDFKISKQNKYKDAKWCSICGIYIKKSVLEMFKSEFDYEVLICPCCRKQIRHSQRTGKYKDRKYIL